MTNQVLESIRFECRLLADKHAALVRARKYEAAERLLPLLNAANARQQSAFDAQVAEINNDPEAPTMTAEEAYDDDPLCGPYGM